MQYITEPIHQDNSLPIAYIFDIDGTLAKMGERSPCDLSEKLLEDKVNESVRQCLEALSFTQIPIIICTGRQGTQACEEYTKNWLKDHDIAYEWILMRKEGDMRPDYVIKEEMWRKICDKYYVLAMFDDRKQVVDHARKLGFTVFQVAEGEF